MATVVTVVVRCCGPPSPTDLYPKLTSQVKQKNANGAEVFGALLLIQNSIRRHWHLKRSHVSYVRIFNGNRE